MTKTFPRDHGHGRCDAVSPGAHPDNGYLVRRARRRRRRMSGERGAIRVLGV